MRGLFSDIIVRTILLPFVVMAVAVTGVQADDIKPLTSDEIDSIAAEVMELHSIPGLAIGVVKDGKTVHLKGYGVRENGQAGRVDESTLFGIASNSKAFATSAIALLVDQKKLSWDDKVIDHLPNFRMYDPWVTREFRVRDLVIHNSGLGLGAGDLMVWPTSKRTRDEIIHNLRYLKPVTSFRSEFAYDNLLYIVAGEVVAKVSGTSFDAFVNENLMAPLGMGRCAADRTGLTGENNYAKPHAVIEGVLRNIKPSEAIDQNAVWAAAGGLQCSARSMVKWVDMHLREGKMANGERLISKRGYRELVKPQTILSVSSRDKRWNNTKFRAYGLGVFLNDADGYKVVSHGGTLLGMISQTYMVPEIGLGIIVLTNQQAYPGRDAIVYSIAKSYMKSGREDWVTKFAERTAKYKERIAKQVAKETSIEPSHKLESLPQEQYVGIYKDAWFGDVTIEQKGGALYFTADKSERIKGKLTHFNGNVFIAYWDDRTLEADAYVSFETSFDGKVNGMTMKPVSPAIDFSFDFQDLDFEKIRD